MIKVNRPENWGKDRLSKLLDDLHENQIASSVNMPDEYEKLREIDDCFFTIGSHLNNPNPMFPAFFMLRCHSALCAAFQLVLGGQNAETYVMTRSALEYAAYRNLISLDEQLAITWLKRHDGQAAFGEQLAAFTAKKLREGLEKREVSLAAKWQTHYQQAIDFGAHPNERAITGSMEKVVGDSETYWQQNFAQAGTTGHEHAMKHAARAGLCSLFIFAHVYSARFELLGLKPRLQALRNGL
jgi:hypothetical protein